MILNRAILVLFKVWPGGGLGPRPATTDYQTPATAAKPLGIVADSPIRLIPFTKNTARCLLEVF